MMTIKRIIMALLILILVIGQLFVKKDNTASYESVINFEQQVQLPEQVKTIMRTHCYDCHSNHTNYPWYASVGVVNFLLNDHIEEGKEHLNFSTWNSYSSKKQLHKLAEVYEEVEEGEMPLKMYRIIHGGLSSNEKEILKSWGLKYKEH